MITEPGIYPDISDAAYHSDPCEDPSLSASVMDEVLKKTLAHAKAKHPRLTPKDGVEEHKHNRGTVVHNLLFGGRGLAVIEEKSYQSNKAKLARDNAIVSGLLPVLGHQLDEAQTIAETIRDKIRMDPLLEAFLDPEAQREVVCVWQEAGRHGPFWCRCKPDLLRVRRGCSVVMDLKITGVTATADEWGGMHAWRMGYSRRAVFYQHGLRQILGEMPKYQFLVFESEEPYEYSIFECTPYELDMAAEEVQLAMTMWEHALHTGNWPGYPREIQWIERPKPAEFRAAAMKARHTMRGADGDAQAPFVMQPSQFGI